MNGEGQCKRVSIISMRMVVSRWVNVSPIWFLHLARCSILWLCNGLSFFSSRSVYHLASVWITEPWCLPPLRANVWMSVTASVPTATCEWVKECKCAIVNVRPSLLSHLVAMKSNYNVTEWTSTQWGYQWVGERVCLPLCAFTLNDILIPLLIYSLAHKPRCFGHECVCLVLCKAMRSCHHETLDSWRKIAISTMCGE